MPKDASETLGPKPVFPPLAWVEGAVVPARDARIPLEDRGVLFAESVYEALVGRSGRLFAYADHRARLSRSIVGIGLDPVRALTRLDEAVAALLRESHGAPCLVYVHVTGGAGPRDHLPAEPGYEPALYATIRSFDFAALTQLQARGITAITVRDNRWPYATYKTTQLLGSILAKREARSRGAEDALFIDANDFVLEGSSTNVFVVKKGRALTPPLTRNLLPGITRAWIVERAPDLVSVSEVSSSALKVADEIFFSSSTRPVVAITHLDGQRIGTGVPGPITQVLARRFQEWMDRELDSR